MDRILRFAAAAALGLAFAAPSALADSHGGVTVGGWIEMIGGTADNDEAGSVDGFSRGFFSRISVSYDETLDNGLTVSGRAAYHLNQRGAGVNITPSSQMTSARMDAGAGGDPDVLYISVGGGFGTVTVGAVAPATCSTLPRPIAFVNGVNTTHYTAFTGLTPLTEAGTFSEFGYCETPEQVSYATPTVNGFKARLTYIPDQESDQRTSLDNAQNDSPSDRPGTNCATTPASGGTGFDIGPCVNDPSYPGQGRDNIKDRIDVAVSWSSSMGAANIELGAGYQRGKYQNSLLGNHGGDMESTTIAGTIGFGAVTLGASWFSTEKGYRPARTARAAIPPASTPGSTGVPAITAAPAMAHEEDGYTLAAKYNLGNLTLGSTWSTAERSDVGSGTQEDSALVLGASYAMGGGLTTWIEYMDLETDHEVDPINTATGNKIPESDDIILVGVTLGF